LLRQAAEWAWCSVEGRVLGGGGRSGVWRWIGSSAGEGTGYVRGGYQAAE